MEGLKSFIQNERIVHTIACNLKLYESFTGNGKGKHSSLDYFFIFWSNFPYYSFIILAFYLLVQGNLDENRVHFELAAFLFNLVVNHGLSIVYKVCCGQLRPSESSRLDFGMPSSHGMYAGFVAWYAPQLLQNIDYSWRLHATLASLLISMLIFYSRVHFKHHTAAQLTVGLCVGIVHAKLAQIASKHYPPLWQTIIGRCSVWN